MKASRTASRPTLRTLAAIAGVTPAAISMALRNHSRISSATRQRIQELARKHGYRPDPEVTKLMHHLRTQRTKRLQATLCALTTKERGDPYAEEILTAARARATALGYALDTIHLEPRLDDPHYGNSLERILLSRGVQGLLFLPMAESVVVDHLIDWRKFSVVATTYTVRTPNFHRVVPHQFGNVLMACQVLVERGYRRIGLAVSSSFDLRVQHHLTAALAWHNNNHPKDAVPPYVHAGNSMDGIATWLRAHRPDVVLAHNTADLLGAARAAGLSVPGSLALANFHNPQNRVFAGVDEKVEEIATTAIDLLTGMVMRGDKGIPKTAHITMLEGGWIEGTSVRKTPLATPKRKSPRSEASR